VTCLRSLFVDGGIHILIPRLLESDMIIQVVTSGTRERLPISVEKHSIMCAGASSLLSLINVMIGGIDRRRSLANY
jgi:hypothetical protein